MCIPAADAVHVGGLTAPAGVDAGRVKAAYP
jgi:hypothetical protein